MLGSFNSLEVKCMASKIDEGHLKVI